MCVYQTTHGTISQRRVEKEFPMVTFLPDSGNAPVSQRGAAGMLEATVPCQSRTVGVRITQQVFLRVSVVFSQPPSLALVLELVGCRPRP